MAKVGAKTKYTPELLKKAKDYLANYKGYGDQMPMICGLALAVNVHKDTIYTWIKEEGKEELSDLVSKIMMKQEGVLFNNALSGDFNASIAKLALTKHGYSDKQDQQVTGANGGAQEHKWTVEFISAAPKD